MYGLLWPGSEKAVLGQLKDVPVAAVQGALSCCAVAALVLGSHRVNDEPGR